MHQKQIDSLIHRTDDVGVVGRFESFDARSTARVDAGVATHYSQSDDGLIHNHVVRDMPRVLQSSHKLHGHASDCDAHSSLRLRETQPSGRPVMKSTAVSSKHSIKLKTH